MRSVFSNAVFIKPDRAFDPAFRGKNLAPMFRRTFSTRETANAKLYVCGLGYAYYYINGKPVSADLFTAPVSNYEKALWYTVYDVSDLLRAGENTVAVICGNGWFNEDLHTSWNFETATYRDHPKFILRLAIGDRDALLSDGSWKCQPESAIRFNALRSGEFFDATAYDKAWCEPRFNDAAWETAKVDDRPPRGVFRECLCEPIREAELLDPVRVLPAGNGKWIYDMGRNISGYVRLTATGTPGQLLTIRYAERMKDGRLDRDGLSRFYPASEFQTDRFLCSGEPTVWSPRFTYHGFRFMEIEGLRDPSEVTVRAAFVHQMVEPRTAFHCSDPALNSLFEAGRASSLSNFFYLVSDCPTREKLGWLNDTQMSAEQFLTDFHVEKLLKKWLYDIYDAMREDGSMPGIAPTPGWGYEWGNGPLSDGALFEIPYRLYLHTNDPRPLVGSLPWFDRYLTYLKKRENEQGDVCFGLGDWATAGNRSDIPVPFINAVLQQKFYRIAALAATLAGDGDRAGVYRRAAIACKRRVYRKYLLDDGSCRIDKQSAVAILIFHGLYRDLSPLKAQLKRLVEANGFHHDCGQLGHRSLFEALTKCGLQEYAMRVLLATGFPSYLDWQALEPSTLWEHWRISTPEYNSANHHMNSHFMAWLVHTVLGMRPGREDPAFPAVSVAPYYFQGLRSAEGTYRGDNGTVGVSWARDGGRIALKITVTGEMTARYRGKTLCRGTHEFRVKGK